MADDDDLSDVARAALAEFLAEQSAALQTAEEFDQAEVPAIDAFQEDWGLSQFWCSAIAPFITLRDRYAEETSAFMGKALVELARSSVPEGRCVGAGGGRGEP